ncbi:GNAT family N-acetyltransferase [Anaerotignum faecicola]|nr:GNAT family N-acetyltransferase [Anaerotignum faecicola]
MKMIRRASIDDKEGFKKLWDLSFTDSQNFRDWFFANRFVPDYSICIEEDGGIVSEAQSIPCHIKIRGAVLNCSIMVGACTHPDYKKRGYMKEIYTGYMNMVRDMGIVLCAHSPAVLRTYFNVGHFPVSDTAFVEIERAEAANRPEFDEFDLKGSVSPLLPCYAKAAEKYSGIISRSYMDFRLKADDYLSDGGKCISICENGAVAGYAVYYDTPDMLYGEEIMALTPETEQRLVDSLIYLGTGKSVKIKLPPDTKSFSSLGKVTVGPRNVLGLANAEKLLKAVGMGLPYAVEIKDEIVAGNNGIFNLKGERTDRKPAVSMSAGNLTQWITGYRSIKELEEEGKARVYIREEAQALDVLLPKQVCHIVDEY